MAGVIDSCSACGEPLRLAARFCTRCAAPVIAGEHLGEPSQEPPPALFRESRSPTTFAPQVAAGIYALPPGWVLRSVQAPKGSAVAAMVLGIVSWALLGFGIGVFTGPVTAPLAVALGWDARHAIKEDSERWSGSAHATAGLWLGMSWLLTATVIISILLLVRLFSR